MKIMSRKSFVAVGALVVSVVVAACGGGGDDGGNPSSPQPGSIQLAGAVSVTVAITDDTQAEAEETFAVSLSNPTAGLVNALYRVESCNAQGNEGATNSGAMYVF